MAYKTSKQREMILSFLREMDGHISAEQLFKHINKSQKISLATIYRNLGILVELKEIKKIPLDDGFVYDKTCIPHYHFYCKKCETLFDLESKDQVEIHQALQSESVIGEIDSYELTLKGTCINCKKQTNGGN